MFLLSSCVRLVKTIWRLLFELSDILNVIQDKVSYLAPPLLSYWLLIVTRFGIVAHSLIDLSLVTLFPWVILLFLGKPRNNTWFLGLRLKLSILFYGYDFVWIEWLIHDLRLSITRLIPLHCDSQVALHIAGNPIFMTKQNTLRLIATLFVMPSRLVFYLCIIFAVSCNPQIFSPKLFT